MPHFNTAQRRTDAEAAIQRLELERQDITSRLLMLAQKLPVAEARITRAETHVTRSGTALAGEMEGPSLGRTIPALREQYAAAQSERVEARSELDKLMREDAECRRRLDQITLDIPSWKARCDRAN